MEGDFLEDEDGEGGAHYHAQEDGDADEAVLGELIEVVVVGGLTVGQYAHCQSAEGLVGVDAWYHREQRGEEAGLCRGFCQRGEEDGEKADEEGGDEGGEEYVHMESLRIHQQEAEGVAEGGYDAAVEIGPAREAANGREADSGYR